MLKYIINANTLSTSMTEMSVISREINNVGSDDTLLSVTCYYAEDYDITEESTLYLSELYDISPFNTYGSDFIEISTKPDIVDVNLDSRYVTFTIDKYYNLTIGEIETYVEDGVVKLRFRFEQPHYFRNWDDDISFYVKFYGSDGEYYEKFFENCEIEDELSLIWTYDSGSPYMDEFMCNVFRNDTYRFVGYEGNEDSVTVEEVPSHACFTDELYIKVKLNQECEDKFLYYEKDCNEGSTFGLTCFRGQFVSDFPVFIETGKLRLILPLSQMHDVTLHNEDIVANKYVLDEIENSINKSKDMEKRSFHPVMIKNPETFDIEDIVKIKFNMHFRQHRGKDWTADDNVYWNGVDNETIMLQKMVDSPYGERFFTFSDKSKQSDLLAYLGFSNLDVKYMKNKLKKSFIRLMWFDSDNSSRQNLLFYSNVYIDSGALYMKYMKNAYTEGYVIPRVGTGTYFNGAKVNMEYAPNGFTNLSDDELEEHRLSSQVVLTDIYDSEASSNGYNLYLWHDNGIGDKETDLYLKIYFNHAGYGRTIPFFVPFFDYEKDGRYGFKTFDEILTDWREGSGYGIRKFNKYSYIHFKCRYDSTRGRYLYYLDPETYGEYALYGMQNNNDSSPNELEINLYEGKVSFLNDADL